MSDHEVQRWNPEQYARNARFVADLGLPAVELLDPRPGEHILDLGCGDGALTQRLGACGCKVVGIDSSPEMIAAARALGLDARLGDACSLRFAGEFDAVFSNAALHWMADPAAVVDGAWRALRPGGRFVAEMGGHGNVAAILAALDAALAARGRAVRPPWYFPTSAEYRGLLEARGFVVASIELFPRPTPLPGGLRPWLETFAGIHTDRLPENERGAYIEEVVAFLAGSLRDTEGHWHADYVRLRFVAHKPRSAAAHPGAGSSSR